MKVAEPTVRLTTVLSYPASHVGVNRVNRGRKAHYALPGTPRSSDSDVVRCQAAALRQAFPVASKSSVQMTQHVHALSFMRGGNGCVCGRCAGIHMVPISDPERACHGQGWKNRCARACAGVHIYAIIHPRVHVSIHRAVSIAPLAESYLVFAVSECSTYHC